jgi:hypothetical protein
VIEDHDPASRPADAAHLARHLDGIRYDADEIWRVHDVERVVWKGEARGVHLEQAHVAHSLLCDFLVRLVEHGARQVDSCHAAVARVERQVDPGADPNLEDAVTRRHRHALHGLQSARVQSGPEDPVVHRSELGVHASNEVRLYGRDG